MSKKKLIEEENNFKFFICGFLFFAAFLFMIPLYSGLYNQGLYQEECIKSHVEIEMRQFVGFGNRTDLHPNSEFIPTYNETWLNKSTIVCDKYALVRYAEGFSEESRNTLWNSGNGVSVKEDGE